MEDNILANFINLLAKLPSVGQRSARRIALHIVKNREKLLPIFISQLNIIQDEIKICELCKNIDTISPCNICRDPKRNKQLICVVEDVADLWAIERSKITNCTYHVLGGTLSAIDGVGPNELYLELLENNIIQNNVREILLATNATIDGQVTAHYIMQRIKTIDPDGKISVTKLACGVPLGGEIDYMDSGTLNLAFKERQPV